MYFAFLGSLDNPKSVGTNNLIKEFAQIVTTPEDILLHYGLIEKTNENLDDINHINKIDNVPKEYIDIYTLITKKPIDINEIAKKSKLDLKSVMSKLIMLELEGKIKKIAGNRYIKGDE